MRRIEKFLIAVIVSTAAVAGGIVLPGLANAAEAPPEAGQGSAVDDAPRAEEAIKATAPGGQLPPGVKSFNFEENLFNIETENASVTDLVELLETTSGVDIVLYEGISGKATINLKSVGLEQLVKSMLISAGEENWAAHYEEDGNALVKLTILPKAQSETIGAGDDDDPQPYEYPTEEEARAFIADVLGGNPILIDVKGEFVTIIAEIQAEKISDEDEFGRWALRQVLEFYGAKWEEFKQRSQVRRYMDRYYKGVEVSYDSCSYLIEKKNEDTYEVMISLLYDRSLNVDVTERITKNEAEEATVNPYKDWVAGEGAKKYPSTVYSPKHSVSHELIIEKHRDENGNVKSFLVHRVRYPGLIYDVDAHSGKILRALPSIER